MKKRVKRRNKQALEVPVSAMIDVIFLLLIFFIVTAKPIITEAQMSVNLPSSDTTAPKEEIPTIIEIHVLKDSYFLGNVHQSLEYIKSQLTEIANYDPEVTVSIKTSPAARHENFVRILDICSKAGLKNLNIFTLK